MPDPTGAASADSLADRCVGEGVVDDAVRECARTDAPRVLSMLASRFGDLDIADDAVQEALVRATSSWRVDGIPDQPAAWLHVVARRIAVDSLRRDGSRRRRLRSAAHELVATDDEAISSALVDDRGVDPGDERLRLLLLCCHPALSREAQIALTLRLVGGLTTEEIAAGFLVATPTLAQRISRAKTKIRAAAIPMSLPSDIAERLDVVLAILYLTFNEGYLSRVDAADREPQRVDLSEEAIRLAELVARLAPTSAESVGLLALMRFTHARRDARFRSDRGIDRLVLLADQDRTQWHLEEIRQGNRELERAMSMMEPGPLQLQALIASHHANARTAADTDWVRIVALYDQLVALQPSPVVRLNRAAAVAMADGPLVGLDALDAIDGLDRYHLFHSTRAELLSRVGRESDALEAFRRAEDLATNRAEVAHLADRVARHETNRAAVDPTLRR